MRAAPRLRGIVCQSDIGSWMSRTLTVAVWPAPGSEDTELGVFMGPEVGHGEAEVYARVPSLRLCA